MKNKLVEIFWILVRPLRFLIQNFRNAIWFRFDYNDRIDELAFWHEVNIGWYEMQEEHDPEYRRSKVLGFAQQDIHDYMDVLEILKDLESQSND